MKYVCQFLLLQIYLKNIIHIIGYIHEKQKVPYLTQTRLKYQHISSPKNIIIFFLHSLLLSILVFKVSIELTLFIIIFYLSAILRGFISLQLQ